MMNQMEEGSLLDNHCLPFIILAGRVTTNEELENMLESGNPSIFTSDVSVVMLYCAVYCYCMVKSYYCHLLVEEEYIIWSSVVCCHSREHLF